MVRPRVPHRRVVVAGRGGVLVVEHGVQGHLEGDADLAEVAGEQAGGHRQAAARALPAHHDLGVVEAQILGVGLQVEQRRVAVLEVGGEGALQRAAVLGHHHDGAELVHQAAQARASMMARYRPNTWPPP